MAIIYTYPRKSTPVLADTILLNDSQDANKTKTATLESLANVIDDTVTLQEVLDVGRTAYYSFSTVPQHYASIQLGRTDASGNNPLDTVVVDGQTGNITMSAGQHGSTANLIVGGSTTIGASPLVFNSAGTELTVGGGDFTINATGTNDLALRSYILTAEAEKSLNLTSATDDVIITSGGGTGEDIILNAAVGNFTSTSNDFIVTTADRVHFDANGYIDLDTGGQIRIGLSPNRPSSISLATDGIIDVFHGGSPRHITSNGRILLPNGSGADPQYSFNSDGETGMFLSSVGELGFTASGSQQMVLDANLNVAKFSEVITSKVGIALANATIPVPDLEETIVRFAQGEFQAEFFDGNTAVPGLVYTGNSGTWQLINNRMTGSGRIYVTGGGTPFPSANLGVGNFVINVGPAPLIGLDLLTHFPPSPAKAPGNISISEAIGFVNNPLAVPVAGLSVAGATNYFALKTYVAPGADLQLINSAAPNWSNGIILAFDFSYNLDPA